MFYLLKLLVPCSSPLPLCHISIPYCSICGSLSVTGLLVSSFFFSLLVALVSLALVFSPVLLLILVTLILFVSLVSIALVGSPASLFSLTLVLSNAVILIYLVLCVSWSLLLWSDVLCPVCRFCTTSCWPSGRHASTWRRSTSRASPTLWYRSATTHASSAQTVTRG